MQVARGAGADCRSCFPVSRRVCPVGPRSMGKPERRAKQSTAAVRATAGATRMERRNAKREQQSASGKKTRKADSSTAKPATQKLVSKTVAADEKRRRTTLTTTNLSDKTRGRIVAAELKQVESVATHPQFVADPLAALEQHLSATADRLQPQTADIGRRAKPARR